MTYFSVGLCVLLVVVVLLLAQGGPRRSGGIALPETPADTGATGEESGQSGLNEIRITPETVRPAINTLSRPVAYQRTQTVETFWSGGSGKSVSQVAVSGSYTRIDTAMPDGSTYHMLVTGAAAAVWYDDDASSPTVLQAEKFTADSAQRMLSYETVLSLPVEDIAQADYREEDGVYCIYVATQEDEDGYADSYWVSVSSGLLLKAERRCGGELVYRFTSSEPEGTPPEEELFQLPAMVLLNQALGSGT